MVYSWSEVLLVFLTAKRKYSSSTFWTIVPAGCSFLFFHLGLSPLYSLIVIWAGTPSISLWDRGFHCRDKRKEGKILILQNKGSVSMTRVGHNLLFWIKYEGTSKKSVGNRIKIYIYLGSKYREIHAIFNYSFSINFMKALGICLNSVKRCISSATTNLMSRCLC